MYSNFQLLKNFLRYYWHADNGKGHGVHSPFVFDFIQHVLNNKCHYKAPDAIEAKRKELFRNTSLLQIEDFGAGSRSSASKTVGHIAHMALKPRKYAQVLFRLASHYKIQHMVELGTSLGITTAYLAAAQPKAQFISIEGSTAIAEEARKNLRTLGYGQVKIVEGNFDRQLLPVLREMKMVDLAYVDGNHRYEPTYRYFCELLPYLHEYSILVFDDIHWSEEMERAWKAIQEHPSVQYTIDIFFLGFVFFRKDFKVKQHFMIRF